MSRALVLLAALCSSVARADCPSVDTWLARAEADLVSLRLPAAEEALSQAEASFSCGPPATAAQLARFWRAEGVSLTLRKRAEEAGLSFEAARRLEPQVWTPAFGAELEKAFRAAPKLTGPPSELRLDPWDARYQGHLDGQPANLPTLVGPGLHLVQAGVGDDGITFGKIVLASDGDAVVVATPFPRDPGLVTETPTAGGDKRSHRGALALITSGGAAALAGGALWWLADRQNQAYPDAVDAYESGQLSRQEASDQVVRTHRAQVGLSVGGGALLAAGAGAAVVGVIRW